MPTLLQAQAAVEASKKAFARALKTAQAAPNDKAAKAAQDTAAASLTKAYDVLIGALGAQPGMGAKLAEAVEAKVIHREKYEKVTTETPDKEKPESEDPAASVPASGGGEDDPPSTQDSAAPSAREAAIPPGKGKTKMAPKNEAEEEKALLAAYESGTKGYARDLRGTGLDAYGVQYGPAALLKAVQKALGTSGVQDTFGALAGLPERLKSNDEIAAKVDRLARNDRATRVETLIATAKREGKIGGKAHEKDIRTEAMSRGTSWLKGRLAVMPKVVRTLEDGGYQPREGADGGRGHVGEHAPEDDHAAILATMHSDEERAAYLAEFDRLSKARTPKAPAV